MMQQIPLVDLKAQYATLREDITAAMAAALESMALVLGPNVSAFEAEFADFCRVEHAIGVGSGTDALYLALRACGVGPGDEVITASNSFFATAEAIVLLGARPVFVDVDPSTYTLDPSLLADAITRRTKAIVPVHLFGQMADMPAILQVAREHGLRVVEDACQAHGAEDHGLRAGGVGDAAAFSFYMSKNLGAYGEAGAVTTRSAEIAEQVRLLRDHGAVRRYEHVELGLNSRLDELQAAVLRVKLRHVERWNTLRRERATLYDEALSGLDVVRPIVREGVEHAYHLYVVQVRPESRDAVREGLAKAGVATAIHYPIPIHRQPALRSGETGATLPVTDHLAPRIVSLPMYPELHADQVRYIGACLREFLPPRAVQ